MQLDVVSPTQRPRFDFSWRPLMHVILLSLCLFSVCLYTVHYPWKQNAPKILTKNENRNQHAVSFTITNQDGYMYQSYFHQLTGCSSDHLTNLTGSHPALFYEEEKQIHLTAWVALWITPLLSCWSLICRTNTTITAFTFTHSFSAMYMRPASKFWGEL